MSGRRRSARGRRDADQRTWPAFLKYPSAWGVRYDGYVAVRATHDAAPGADLKAAVEIHNARLRDYFRMCAKEQGVTPEQFARDHARQSYEGAEPGEWFLAEDGTWSQKQ